jgi:hypothetical protein
VARAGHHLIAGDAKDPRQVLLHCTLAGFEPARDLLALGALGVHGDDAPLAVAQLLQHGAVNLAHLPALLAAAEQRERVPASIRQLLKRSARGVRCRLAPLKALAVDQPVHHRSPQPPVHLPVLPPAAARKRSAVGLVEGLLDVVGRAVPEPSADFARELVAQRPARDPIECVAGRLAAAALDDCLPH